MQVSTNFKNASFIAFIALFAFLLFINVALPRQSDDFNHYYSALEGFKSAKNAYLNWNARIGELINNSLIAGINPYLFDVLNACVGVIFIFAFFMLVFARLPRDFKDIANIALMLFILMFSCAFGSVFAWGAGSVNYLWGLCFIMLFLLPWRAYLAKMQIGGGNNDISQNRSQDSLGDSTLCKIATAFHKSPKVLQIITYLLFLILSFAAGMASEMIGILSIIVIFCFNIFIIYRKKYCGDSIKIPVFLNIAFLFFILGWLALYLSPGHAKRASLPVFDGVYMSLSQILSLDFMSLLKRIARSALSFKNNILLAFSLLLIFFLCVRKISVKNIAIFIVLSVIILVLNNNLKIAGVRAFWLVHLLVLCLALLYLAKREISLKQGVFYRALLLLFLAFCLCMASTIQFPALPHRARLGDSMILIAMIALLFDRFAERNFARFAVVLCALYGAFVAFAFVEYRVKWENMIASIESSKSKGQRHIVVDDIFHSRYKNLINWGNPTDNANEWPNPTYAQYFGVESFVVKRK